MTKRKREKTKEEKMKPKSRKFSRRFSIPGCLAAEPPRSSRDSFPREYPRMVGTGKSIHLQLFRVRNRL